MKRRSRLLVSCLFFFILNNSWAQSPLTLPQYASLPKIDPQLLRDDLSLLQKILEANHPSLYWYTPKDSMDLFFAQAINSIHDSMDEVAFKNKVSYVVSKIRCGHTTVRFSKAYSKKAARFRYPQFPLSLKAWSDSLVVLQSVRPRDSIFKRGMIITSINGVKNRWLLDSIFEHMSTDGYSENFKNQVISGNFPAWYKTVLGIDSSYAIGYIDSTGRSQVVQVNSYYPRASDLKDNRALPAVQKPTRKQLRKAGLLEKRSLVIDTANSTAYMRLSTFSGGGLPAFFRRSFRTIHELNVQHLVIDLRENGGGKVHNSILLGKYLADHPFKVGDTVVAKARSLKYSRYISNSIGYWFSMHFGSNKKEDGLIHLNYYENHFFDPKKDKVFKGDIYVIQGGYTFSAATMFISFIKGQKNVTTVGEETGGGYYGTSAMHIPTITLPNTKLQIGLPTHRLVIDHTRPRGHGFIPDVEVGPSSTAIRQGVDLKLQKIRELIQQKSR
jgi:hypothetical protein